MLCRARVAWSGLYYQEFIWRLGHRAQLLEECANEALDHDPDLIDEELGRIRLALTEHLGERGLLRHTLQSVVAGANDPLPLDVRSREVDAMVEAAYLREDVYLAEASGFLLNGDLDPRGFESIASVPRRWC